ncbi:hypothetical protein ES703_04040 [subsurface metagenome]
MQEETTYLNMPCLTLRKNTERPITIYLGTNTLCRTSKEIIKQAEKILNGRNKKGKIPLLWDGHTAERIVDILTEKSVKLNE